MNDDLTLEVGGRALSGWTSVRVTRGIERVPSDFEIEMTDLYPAEADAFVVTPGDACVVKLGGDVVVTGYVDRYAPSIDSSQHTITVVGRGKCSDLVDCAAEWPGGQIVGANALAIAQKLAQPYGVFSGGTAARPISVYARATDLGPQIPVQNLILGESAFNIIERVCRFAALLAYEDENGNLCLDRVGTDAMASGFEQGKNVQRARIEYGMDQRYSEVNGYIQSFDTFQDLGDVGNLQATAKDPNVTRHRRMTVIAEAGDSLGFPVLKKRVEWEVARRLGRSQALRVTVDSWRDELGQLWSPNKLAPIRIPALKLNMERWIISEVTYNRNLHTGTTADLVLMPKEAFLPQPVVLLPGFADVKPVEKK
jgi:prophage tail gpP-like protein